MQAGLEDQVQHLRASSDSFSLPAWRKWARLLTDDWNQRPENLQLLSLFDNGGADEGAEEDGDNAVD